MKAKVLLAYASKYGSTRDVAEAIAAVLSEAGMTVDLQPMGKVRTLAGYDAVLLGAPLYFGAWHKDALKFLTGSQEALAKLPMAVFALGPTMGVENEHQGACDQLNGALQKFPWLKPLAIEVFGGKYDPARLRFPDTLIASLPASPLHQAPASDLRDWAAIRSWALSLPERLLNIQA